LIDCDCTLQKVRVVVVAAPQNTELWVSKPYFSWQRLAMFGQITTASNQDKKKQTLADAFQPSAAAM
jgi:hypothetical protein